MPGVFLTATMILKGVLRACHVSFLQSFEGVHSQIVTLSGKNPRVT
jgi:hypothetical protein